MGGQAAGSPGYQSFCRGGGPLALNSARRPLMLALVSSRMRPAPEPQQRRSRSAAWRAARWPSQVRLTSAECAFVSVTDGEGACHG